MQRKSIKVGGTYAMGSRQRTEHSTARKIRILAVGEKRTVKGESYRFRRNGGHFYDVSGIVAIDADVPFEGDLPEDKEIKESWFGHDEPFWVEGRNIWETWADWETQEGQKAVRKQQAARRQAEETAAQQREIDHLMSLLPAEAWKAQRDQIGRPLVFEPGMTPRLTVANLTALLKAARTAALDEAFGESAEGGQS